MFGLRKKKLQESLAELPPPPAPPSLSSPMSEIPEIRPETGPVEEAPALPPLPSFEPETAESSLPEPPAPELPEAPLPETSPEIPSLPALPEVAEESGKGELTQLPELKPIEEVTFAERIRKPLAPAFVSMDEYRAILEHSNRVREKLSESEELVQRLDQIKTEEEKVFSRWRSQLEDAERKLEQIDRVIAKTKR
jgi:hypothetical protein